MMMSRMMMMMMMMMMVMRIRMRIRMRMRMWHAMSRCTRSCNIGLTECANARTRSSVASGIPEHVHETILQHIAIALGLKAPNVASHELASARALTRHRRGAERVSERSTFVDIARVRSPVYVCVCAQGREIQ